MLGCNQAKTSLNAPCASIVHFSGGITWFKSALSAIQWHGLVQFRDLHLMPYPSWLKGRTGLKPKKSISAVMMIKIGGNMEFFILTRYKIFFSVKRLYSHL